MNNERIKEKANEKYEADICRNQLVSIVTPVFNQEKYIEETIESILSQTYKAVEYIIVDDGSTDRTSEILENYSSEVKVIHQNNMGQSAALNIGWNHSRGGLLGYISADDILKPNCIEEVVKYVENSDAGVFYVDFDLIDTNSQVLREAPRREYDERQMVENLICFPGVGTFFRRPIFERVGGWNPNLYQVPDFEFWLRVSRFSQFQRVPKNLAAFRVHSTSRSVRAVTAEESDEIIRVMLKHFLVDNANVKDKCLSNAYLASARSHLQSGRFFIGFLRTLKAIRINPRISLRVCNYFFLIKGLLKRGYYSIMENLT